MAALDKSLPLEYQSEQSRLNILDSGFSWG